MKIKTPLPTLLSLAVAVLAAQIEAATDPAPGSPSEAIDNENLAIKISPDPLAEKQIEWFKAQKGSFFSPKVTYGNIGDGTSLSGMYAIAPIAKGEEIFHVPVEQFITADMDSDDDDDDDRSPNVSCDTAWNLAEERRKGKSSHWEPFVTYCFESFDQEDLPANWSDEALELFYQIVDDVLEPQYLGDRGSYEDECGYDADEEYDEILEAAYRIVIARGWSGVLLPMVDMVNHRNGKWYNADQAGSAHIGKDVSFVALRDIKAGEQIYDSYNECPDTDCAGIKLKFTMPQILEDFGFVEQYPRRFNIAVGLDIPVFELDENENGEIEITWLDGTPDDDELEWFSDQLERLADLEEFMNERLEDLESHEQYTIKAFYEAMMEGLQLASLWNDPEEHEYMALEDHVDEIDHTKGICAYRYVVPGKEVSSEGDQSIYQHVEFRNFNDTQGNKLDTCLYLDKWLHMCNSLRPHYHEWLVHYPAQFLKQVKRVLFLGGGDNMILHEVLKYPELEFVIGMELDQMVVRGSFKHFKIQPHYDGKVEWWFGDAAKSLRMLPDDYLGTFDLVVVDLLTYVTESLMVTDELNILDYSMLFLNEGGILTMNEDFIAPTKANNAQYTVDLEVMEVPVFCQQSINMLSNTVDFMIAEPIDHGVESLVVKPGATKSDTQKFNSWWNYHRNDHHKLKERKAMTVDASDNTQGVMIVLEAEKVSLSTDSMTEIYDTIAKSLKKLGLTVLSSSSFKEEALMITLKEGYVMLRSWFEHQYFAFDLVLWSSLHKLGATKAELITAVGAESTSSYNIVTGGMRGVETVQLPKYPADISSDYTTCPSDAPYAADLNLGDLDVILQEMTGLAQSADPVTMVFCPEKEKPCHSLKALRNNDAVTIEKVIPVWACASGDSMQREKDCESSTLDVLKSALSQGKINQIVIDPESPRKMGQVLKKVVQNPRTQEQILASQFIVLAPALDSSESWRGALLEWFRTDVVMMNPDNHAEVLFSNATCSGNLRMSIFSAGDEDFYSHLVNVIEKCETKSGLVTEIPSVQGGKHVFVANLDPPVVGNESSYDKTAADSQWASQNPLGMQTIIQFESKIPQLPLDVGDKVLGNFDTHPLTGKWFPATIKSINEDGTYDLRYISGDLDREIPRHLIRKWDIASDIAVSDAVLALRGDDEDWYLGKVLEKTPDNKYKVHIYDSTGKVETKELYELMKRFENTGKLPMPEVSCALLKEMLQKGIASSNPTDETKVEIHDGAGDGCVATAFWSQGSTVAIWDGGHHIDLNIFTFEENKQMHSKFSEAFIGMTSSFSIVLQNEQPRGFGNVVNFKHEMKTTS